MSIYFFDDNQILKATVPYRKCLSVEQTQELTDGLLGDHLTATIPIDESLTGCKYMAVKSHAGNAQSFDMYHIILAKTDAVTTTFTGIQLAYYELAGYVVEDIRPVDRTPLFIAQQILLGTDWRVGYVDPAIGSVSTNFYFLSAKDSFAKLQEVANCEVVFKVEISGTGVIDKWVEIYKQLGDKTLKRFSYGANALEVVREIGTSDIYTALIGRGKGEESGDGYGRKLTFEDVAWATPVSKPLGQKYVELPSATAIYGIKTYTGKSPRIGIIEFNDTTDPAVLLQQTYNALVDVARPKTHFKSVVLNIGKTNIGDVVTIHRHELGIHYETRVFKIVRDKIDDNRTQVELGDAVSSSSVKKQSQTQSLIRDVKTEIETNINYVMQTADGKNMINYGNDEPTIMRTGDLWYRDHPSIAGSRQMMVYNGTTWEEQTFRADMLTGTIDAQNLNVVNINMDSLVGQNATLVQGSFNAINATVQITGEGMVSIHNNGRYFKYGNGSLKFGYGAEEYQLRSALDSTTSRSGLILESTTNINAPVDFDLYGKGTNTINLGRDDVQEGFHTRIQQVHNGRFEIQAKTNTEFWFSPGGTTNTADLVTMHHHGDNTMSVGYARRDVADDNHAILNGRVYFGLNDRAITLANGESILNRVPVKVENVYLQKDPGTGGQLYNLANIIKRIIQQTAIDETYVWAPL